MGTLAVTCTPSEARRLAKAIEKAANGYGSKAEADATLTIDNAPSTGSVSVVYDSGTTYTI